MNLLETLAPEQQPLPDLRQRSIAILAEQLRHRSTPDYPAFADRLRLTGVPYDKRGLVSLPNEGAWTAGQLFPTQQQKLDEIIRLVGAPRLLKLDADYRVLHPWWREMLLDPDVGAVVGKGFYWRWGVNYTADSAVFCRDHLLLVKRGDTGQWALPGGFVDPNEQSSDSAIREVREETGLDIGRYQAKQDSLYSGPVLDIRTTLHAWAETSLFRYTLDVQELPEVRGDETEVMQVEWFPVNALPTDLYGSHILLIELALRS